MSEPQHMPDPNDILGGGAGIPTATYPREAVGLEIGGRIIEQPASYQETEYVKGAPGTGKPKVFPSGDPIYGIKVTVQTTMRDPAIDDDDGKRRHYIEGKRKKEAVRDAVLATGQKLAFGGELYIAYTGIEAGADPADPQAPKTWQARYVPPGAAQANDALGVTPAASTPAASNGAAVPAAPAGIDPAVWATFTPEQRAALTPAAPVDAPPPGVAPEVWATLNAEQQAAMRNLVGA